MIILLISILKFTSISCQPSPFGFNVQYIGSDRYVSKDEEQNRTFCENYWCTNDASMLFTQSSQYPNVDPCVDFKNFTIGKLFEVEQINDRNLYRGLQKNLEDRFYNRIRRVLSEKISETGDNRIVKVLKSTFKQCIKSPHTFRHLDAHRDAIEYLQSLGGSPYLSKHIAFNPNKFDASKNYKFDTYPGNVEKDTWNAEKFSIRKCFKEQPLISLALFFHLGLERYPNNTFALLTTSDYKTFETPEEFYLIFKDLFESLEDSYHIGPHFKKILKEQVISPTVYNIWNFSQSRQKIEDKYLNESFTLMTIKELQNLTSNDEVYWLDIINEQLLSNSKINENELISVRPNYIKSMVDNLMNTDKRVLADEFVISILYSYRYEIILHFHNIQNFEKQGTKQSYERWLRCVENFSTYIPVGILVMHERERRSFDTVLGDFNRGANKNIDIYEHAEKFLQEAIAEVKALYIEGNSQNLSISSDVLLKLKNITIILGLTNKTLPMEKLEDFYRDLDLNGSEGFLESMIKIRKNYVKIYLEPHGSWRKRINNIAKTFLVSYDISDGNYLYVHPIWLMYPWYHPLRPRFFNMATLYQNTVHNIIEGMVNYMNKKYKPIEPFTNEGDNFEIAYRSYKQWLTNHTDLEIGANQLTHLQLYWVANSVARTLKYHRTVPKSYFKKARLQFSNLHVFYKVKPGFQEAFGCEATEDEIRKFLELRQVDGFFNPL